MFSRKWTIRIWMMECAVLAGLLGACKFAPGLSFIAFAIGIVWWLGPLLPHLFNWIGVFLGSGTLLPGALVLSARHERLGIGLGILGLAFAAATVWAIFALLPLIHREMLRYLSTTRSKSDDAYVD